MFSLFFFFCPYFCYILNFFKNLISLLHKCTFIFKTVHIKLLNEKPCQGVVAHDTCLESQSSRGGSKCEVSLERKGELEWASKKPEETSRLCAVVGLWSCIKAEKEKSKSLPAAVVKQAIDRFNMWLLFGDQRDGSVVRSPCCFSREPEFDSQHHVWQLTNTDSCTSRWPAASAASTVSCTCVHLQTDTRSIVF